MSVIVVTKADHLPYKEWLEYRKQGIGGSDASVVCGMNRYKSSIELWMEKTDQLPYQEAGEAAYWGTQLEELVRLEFTKRTKIEVKQVKQLLKSREYPFMLVNLDGICEHPDYGTCIFEAKTASAYRMGEWEDSIPDEYQLQIQHYMAVTGFQGAYIAVLIGGNTFRWQFVARDEELISMMIQLEKDFWRHVQENIPLPMDGSQAAASLLTQKFPDSKPKSHITLPEGAMELIERYDQACEQLDIITQQKREAENRLKEMIGEHEIGTVGNRIVTWKSISQERLDSKTLKAEHPVLYQKYTNRTSYRRFSIKATV